ncbi:sca1 complex scaffold protein scaa [Anaeramoeba flamelloides]|uniref:Sca1 complex scaffold protein scaa n=1 Tax=Anaeramoeba flamelloides TaxID=1746091 RepID=A0ABQ8Y7H6_9EUKA|nr:sca1 complex scaffold protein scaa [Anaeramoeba flamelloides]
MMNKSSQTTKNNKRKPKYSKPKISTSKIQQRQSPPKKNEQLYFDGKTAFYDINYLQVTTGQLEKSVYKNFKDQKTIQKKLKEFPRIVDFGSFKDYEDAAIKWKKNADQVLEHIKPPIPIGNYYYRPYFHKQPSTVSLNELSETTRGSDSLSFDDQSNSSRKLSLPFENNPLDGGFKVDSTDFTQEELNFIETGGILPEFMEDTECIITDKEHWSNSLVPEEPNPINYKTFEEYESALHRWSQIVMNTLPTIPPHANDFNQLHGFESLESKRQNEEKRQKRKKQQRKKLNVHGKETEELMKSKHRQLKHSKRFPNDFQPWIINFHKYCTKAQPLIKLNYLNKENDQVYLKKILGIESKNINNISKNAIYNCQMSNELNFEIKIEDLKKKFYAIPNKYTKTKLEQLLYQINKSIRENLANKPFRIIGKLHGSFPDETTEKLLSQSKIPPLSNFVLRRKDFKDFFKFKIIDCPQIIQNKRVVFNFPSYDHPKKINLRILQAYNQTYKKKFIHKLEQIELDMENITLHSTYYPLKHNSIKIQTKINETIQLFYQKNIPSKFNLVLGLFASDVRLDSFMKILNHTFLNDYSEILFSDYIFQNISRVDFKILLKLFSRSCSFLLHKKLSFFISQFLQSGIATKLVEAYLKAEEYKAIYYISYGLNFYEGKTTNIYPTPFEASEFSTMIYGQNYWGLEKTIWIYHYLKEILKIMNKKKNKLLFISITKHFKKFLDNQSKLIIQQFQKFKGQFLEDIWKGINHRSTLISGYYLTLLLQLLRYGFNKSILLEKYELMNKIRNLFKSKFSHVRNGGKIILRFLFKTTIYKRFILKEINQSFETFLQDLTPNFGNNNNTTNSKNKTNHQINDKIPGFTEIYTELINRDLKKLNYIAYKKLKDNLYSNLYLECDGMHDDDEDDDDDDDYDYDYDYDGSDSGDGYEKKEESDNNNKHGSFNKIRLDDLTFLDSKNLLGLIHHLHILIVAKSINHPSLTLISKLIPKMVLSMIYWCKIKIPKELNNKKKKSKKKSKKKKISKNKNKNGKSIFDLKLQNFGIMKQKKIIIDIFIFEMIKQIIESANSKLDLLKSNLTKTFTRLLQIPKVYQYLNKNKKCFTVINSITNSSSNNRLSKSLWDFIFIMIFTHKKGLENLIKQRKLFSLMGMVSSGSTIPILSYGLNFMYKLFIMPEKYHLNKLLIIYQLSSINYSDFLKQIQLSHKLFVDFFKQNSLFVKLNMIFMKYCKLKHDKSQTINNNNVNHNHHHNNNNVKICWFVFVRLAKIFYIIFEKDFCSKILKENFKKIQYIESFDTFRLFIFNNNLLESRLPIVGKGKTTLNIYKKKQKKRRFTSMIRIKK